MSSPNFSPSSMAVGAFGAIILLTIGIITGSVLARSGDDTAPAPAAAASTAPAPEQLSAGGAPLRNVENPDEIAYQDTNGISDPDVTAWHDGLAGPITSVLGLLNKPAPTTEAELTQICERITLTMADLKAAPKAPRDEIDQTYRAWVTALDEATRECGGTATGQQRLTAAADAFSTTAGQFDAFIRALDPYFDFSVEPKSRRDSGQ